MNIQSTKIGTFNLGTTNLLLRNYLGFSPEKNLWMSENLCKIMCRLQCTLIWRKKISKFHRILCKVHYVFICFSNTLLMPWWSISGLLTWMYNDPWRLLKLWIIGTQHSGSLGQAYVRNCYMPQSQA